MPEMAHRFKNFIVKLNWPWNQQGRMLWLAGHLRLLRGSRGCSPWRTVLDVVTFPGLSFCREGRVDFQLGSLLKMPLNEAQSGAWSGGSQDGGDEGSSAKRCAD